MEIPSSLAFTHGSLLLKCEDKYNAAPPSWREWVRRHKQIWGEEEMVKDKEALVKKTLEEKRGTFQGETMTLL